MKNEEQASQVSHRAVLTPEQVKEIRKLYELDHITQSVLAERYNVSQSTIGHIVNGKIYKKVA